MRLLPALNIPMAQLESRRSACSKTSAPENKEEHRHESQRQRIFSSCSTTPPRRSTTCSDLAAELKAKKKAGIPHRLCEGKNVALIFEKTSTRTRCSFEVAAHDLGMGATYLDPTGSQIGKKESIADTARVLSRHVRRHRVPRLRPVASSRSWRSTPACPVWNGLTNEFHPTQILADLLTIREHFGSLEGVKLVYMGDARYNMGNSLMVGCAKMGMHFVGLRARRSTSPTRSSIAECQEIAAETGATLDFMDRARCRPCRARTWCIPTSGSPWASPTSVWAGAHRGALRPIR